MTCASDTMTSSSLLGTGKSVENDLEDVEKFQKDMLNLYKSGECSDITLICEEQEFKVHKAILRARCPSMLRMVNLNLPNLTPDSLRYMLLYIYGGNARHQKWSIEQAIELADAADRYNLDGLKRQAEKSVCSRMNIDNVLKVLEIIEENAMCEDSYTYLRSVAIKFIAENIQQVMEQSGWEDLEKEHMTEIIKEMTRPESPQNKKPRLMPNH